MAGRGGLVSSDQLERSGDQVSGALLCPRKNVGFSLRLSHIFQAHSTVWGAQSPGREGRGVALPL